MEKYSDWRDRGTGIAPFLPPASQDGSSAAKGFYTLILLLRMVVVLPLWCVYKLTSSVAVLQVLLKLLMGWKSDLNIQGHRRRDKNSAEHLPQKGDICFCSCSSPFDAIALTLISQSAPLFLMPNGPCFYQLTSSQFVDFIMAGSLAVENFGTKFSNLGVLKEHAVFIFPEGTASNGKSVLPFNISQTLFDDMIENKSGEQKIKTIQLKVNSSLTTPIGVSSRFTYLLRAVSRGVSIKYKITNDVKLNSLDSLRLTLNDNDKYKLVSKSLNLDSKKKFFQMFKSQRR